MTEAVPTGPTTDHASYLGASDIAAVLGIHPYQTALDVWAEKVHGVKTQENEPMKVGKALERPVLEALYAPERNLELYYPGTLVHPSDPWMAASPDAIAGLVGGELDRDVECKIVGRRQMSRWGDPDEGPDGVPEEVLTQATWQLAAIQAQTAGRHIDVADIVALLGTEIRVYGMEFDPKFAADLMEVGRQWWKTHVEGEKMPEVYTEDARRLLARIYPKNVEGMLEMRADVRELAQAWLVYDEGIKGLGELKAAKSAEICALIGEAKGFEDSDGLKATWSPRKGSISYKAIVDALGVPEAERERYRGDPTRVLRITPSKQHKEKKSE